MSTPETPQHVIRQTHITKLNRDSGDVESGWEVTVKDPETGVLVPVFIPDNLYGGEQAQTLIEFELKKVRAVHGLRF